MKNTKDAFDDTSEKHGKIRKEKINKITRSIAVLISAIFGFLIVFGTRKDVGQKDTVPILKAKSAVRAGVNSSGRPFHKYDSNQPDEDVWLAEKDKRTPKLDVLLLEEDVFFLEEDVRRLDSQVRRIKSTPNVIMETDKEGIVAVLLLQEATRKLIDAKYGGGSVLNDPFRVSLDLEFQDTIPDFQENGSHGSLLFEMAPATLLPHSVYTFLEVARNFKSGAFHRNAGHVLQATVHQVPVENLAFQEYSDKFPHQKGTVGYAGRPSGPAFYISIQDNTKNHGPGSQQDHNPYEADSCFGKVIEGFDDVAVKRIHKMPGNGFIMDPKKQVIIKSMTILVPQSRDGQETQYIPWRQQY